MSRVDPSVKVIKKEPIWDYYRKNGYVTGYAANNCDSNIIFGDEYMDNLVINSPRDHDGTGISCDPHLLNPFVGMSDWEGSFAHTPRCLYGSNSFDHTINYTREFFSSYKGDRKMFISTFMDFHEGTYTVAKLMDKSLSSFIKEMVEKDVTVIIFADHGGHLGGLKSHIGFT